MSNQSKKATLAPGTYYIGDLCYVIGRQGNDWMDFLNNSYWKVATNECAGGPVEYKGHKGFAAYTAHGDGSFCDQWGNEYGVDAGMIGIIPIEACDVSVEEIKSRSLGTVFTFTGEVKCHRDAGGTFSFYSDVGNETIDIDTDDYGRYEDDVDYSDD